MDCSVATGGQTTGQAVGWARSAVLADLDHPVGPRATDYLTGAYARRAAHVAAGRDGTVYSDQIAEGAALYRAVLLDRGVAADLADAYVRAAHAELAARYPTRPALAARESR